MSTQGLFKILVIAFKLQRGVFLYIAVTMFLLKFVEKKFVVWDEFELEMLLLTISINAMSLNEALRWAYFLVILQNQTKS